MIIVDLDGTVANCEHRLHYIQGDTKDWDAFFKACLYDKPIENIVSIVRDLTMDCHKICVFLTGRSDVAFAETKAWISEHFPEFILGVDYHLVMRPHGDHTPDHELKPKMLKEFMGHMPHLDVELILEDRSTVVKQWRKLGYTCLQVADGDF